MQNISAKDFYSTTTFNNETKNQLWMSIIADSHDCNCNCNHPFAHLLASIFPPGHKDRVLTIDQILARDYTEKCLSGGRDEEGHGSAAGGIEKEDTKPIKGEKDAFPEEDIDELLAAAAAEEELR